MAPPICVNTTKWAATYTDPAGDSKMEITFAIRSNDGSVMANPLAFATAFNLRVLANLAIHSHVNIIWTGSIYEDVSVSPYGGATYPGTPTAGSIAAAGTAMPNDTAIAIRRNSADVGRWGRGRVFFPIGYGNVFTAQNLVDPVHIGNIITGLQNFQLAIETVPGFTAELGHISREHGGAALDPMIFHRTVQWTFLYIILVCQRSRLTGRWR